MRISIRLIQVNYISKVSVIIECVTVLHPRHSSPIQDTDEDC